jgi:YD repeat-containing protein
MENPLDPRTDIKNTYVYDDSGACIQVEQYRYGALYSREQFEYTNGLLTKNSWEDFYQMRSNNGYFTYQYDTNGILIREDSYIDGILSYYILHELSEENRIEKKYLPDGTLTRTSVYNSEGALIRTSGDSEDTEYVYNANGLLIRFRNHEQTVEYEYDTNEQLVKCTIKNDDTAVIWFDFVYDEKQACTAISAQNVVGDIQLTVEKKDNQSIVISPSGTVYFEITNRTSSYTGMDSVGDTIISYTFYPTGALHFYEESEYTEEYRTDPKDGKVHILYGWEYIRKKTFSPTGELLKSIGYDE